MLSLKLSQFKENDNYAKVASSLKAVLHEFAGGLYAAESSFILGTDHECTRSTIVFIKPTLLDMEVALDKGANRNYNTEAMRIIATNWQQVVAVVKRYNRYSDHAISALNHSISIQKTILLSKMPNNQSLIREYIKEEKMVLEEVFKKFLIKLFKYLNDENTSEEMIMVRMEIQQLSEIFEKERGKLAEDLSPDNISELPTYQSLSGCKNKILDLRGKYQKEKKKNTLNESEKVCRAKLIKMLQVRRNELRQKTTYTQPNWQEEHSDGERVRATLPKLGTPMRIDQEVEKKQLAQGGFCATTLMQCKLTITSTANQSSVAAMQAHRPLPQHTEPKQRILVKKTVKKSIKDSDEREEAKVNLRNEVLFINKFREEQLPHCARYYIRTVQQPQAQDRIYLEYYPISLQTVINNQVKWSKHKRLHILAQICKGLQSYVSQRIVHRDIKPANIMLDATGVVYIIDNGSWAPIYGNDLFVSEDYQSIHTSQSIPQSNVRLKKMSLKLFTSVDYTLPHPPESSMDKAMYERNKKFDMSAFGTIVSKMFDLNKQNLFEESLRYLVLKCRESNPNDRLSAVDACIYLQFLMKYLKVKMDAWGELNKKEQIDGKVDTLEKELNQRLYLE